MPELPEVETTARALRPLIIGRSVVDVWNNWPPTIVTPSFSHFKSRICGQQFIDLTRRGKYLLFQLQYDTLIIHLKMSGHLAVVPRQASVHKHVHTIFELDNNCQLRFRDQRKFGRVYLVSDPEQVVGKLGPEPLAEAFTPEVLRTRLQNRKRALKPLLLDQTFVAGIGNIYADEALFYAGLHPQRTADSLTDTEIIRLHAAIQKVLQMGIEREGASIDLYVKPDGSKGDMQNAVAVFRRTDMPCYVCGTPIRRIRLGGRSTHFCATCQPLAVK
ncbi:MAG: bifunctional DNA-formamidopyrimidine glycosylase/DNA-(apurinic or apyrimidinic site) lyase [Chloroflexi bacterium]|nr:MAG: bifunctional DNA-formamidopyrimidine glycosylase/DNA-(apurinic or apyrimidinic site) lyase [Chloroflexota bacterium]